MKKIMNWVGIFLLILILVQSTVGILSYTQTGNPEGFQNGMGRMNGTNASNGAMPRNNSEEIDSSLTDATEDNSSNNNSIIDTAAQHDRMQVNMGSQEQPGSFSTVLRTLNNGIFGLVLNSVSLGLAIGWIVLYWLVRKQNNIAHEA